MNAGGTDWLGLRCYINGAYVPALEARRRLLEYRARCEQIERDYGHWIDPATMLPPFNLRIERPEGRLAVFKPDPPSIVPPIP